MDPIASTISTTDQRGSTVFAMDEPPTPAPGPSDELIAAEVEPLIQRLPADVPASGRDMIRRAYAVARRAHGTQTRSSGELYIRHPLAVAHILVDLNLDPASIAAGLLHDVPEDTNVGIEEIR